MRWPAKTPYLSMLGITRSRRKGENRTATPMEPLPYTVRGCLATFPSTEPRPNEMARGNAILIHIGHHTTETLKLELYRNSIMTDASRYAAHTHDRRQAARWDAVALPRRREETLSQAARRVSNSYPVGGTSSQSEHRTSGPENASSWAEKIKSSRRLGGCVETLAAAGTNQVDKNVRQWCY